MRPGRFARPPARRAGEDGVLPLINVVFLLLAFFLLAGTIRPPSAFPLRPPEAAGGAQAAAGPALRVALAADGRLALEGRPAGREAVLSAAAGAARIALEADAGADAAATLQLAAALQGAGGAAVALVVHHAAEGGR